MAGIVVGVDGSAHAVGALRFANEEAGYRGCGLTAVEVWEEPYLAADVGESARVLDESAHRRAERILAEQMEKALDGETAPGWIGLAAHAVP